jgi:cobalt/nickel transport protein
MVGASLVEGIITGLILTYIQRHHPEYLTSLRTVVTGEDIATGQAVRRPLWQLLAVGIAALAVVLMVAGLITGGGDPSTMFGADWSSVDWSAVASMLLVTAIIAAILIPLAWLLLPRWLRGIGTAYVVAAVLAPIGLIAPGFAYGEGSAEDLQAELGYIPDGFHQVSGLFGAPFAEYNIPLPFFQDADAPLWHTAIGYEISGILGILLLGVVVYGIALLLRGREPETAHPSERATAV